MNLVTFIGRLTKDVELRKTTSDSYIGSSSIAVNRDRKNAEGNTDTDFFDVKFFGNQAEFAAKYLRKGYKICVSGRIEIRKYINRDNVSCQAIEVLVNSVENLEPKQDDGTKDSNEPKDEAPANESATATGDGAAPEISDDDLPF